MIPVQLPPSSGYPWKFFRTGGLDQVALTTGADLLALEHLDQKLWVALACPVKGLELDEKTLALLDTDGDGRIRVPELLAAIKWAAGHLTDAGLLLAEKDSLPLAAFDTNRPEGKVLLASAKQILLNLGKKDADTITLADATDQAKIYLGTPLNGDGIITPASDTTFAALVTDIIATQGSVPDRSGALGVDQAKVDAFYTACSAYAAWGAAQVAPLGAGSAAALAAVQAVRAKADDYFARCRLAAFDARAAAAINRAETEFAVVAAQNFSATSAEIAHFPLARAEAGRPLPLTDGINPAWTTAVATLRAAAVTPVFGAAKTTLTDAEWAELNARLAPYEAWVAAKAGVSVEPLGLPRVQAILAAGQQADLTALIARDAALSPEFAAVTSLEKLLRFSRDFRTLLHNFVNFADFYSRDRWAAFQAGTLYLDSRSCELCIKVDGPNPLVAMSKSFIAYVACTRAGSPPMTVACCFSQGDSDYLFAGRHGVFYDRRGRDWDAVITSIVDNPISLRQAFWSPYKKVVRIIDEMAAKRAAAADAAANERLGKVADKAVNATVDSIEKPAAPAAAKAAEPKKFDVGVVAALGVAVGAIGGALATAGAVLGRLEWWQFPLVIIGVMLVISLPAVAIAFLKLRQRTLGPILDANGWAINGRVKINIPFGTALTSVATLPPGAQLSLTDPYEDKEAAKQRRQFIAVTVLVVLAALAIWVRWDRATHGDHYLWEAAQRAEWQKDQDAKAAAAAAKKQ